MRYFQPPPPPPSPPNFVSILAFHHAKVKEGYFFWPHNTWSNNCGTLFVRMWSEDISSRRFPEIGWHHSNSHTIFFLKKLLHRRHLESLVLFQVWKTQKPPVTSPLLLRPETRNPSPPPPPTSNTTPTFSSCCSRRDSGRKRSWLPPIKPKVQILYEAPKLSAQRDEGSRLETWESIAPTCGV